jgi:hypothetical protein
VNYSWKRTALTRGAPVINDWFLTDAQGQVVLARLFKCADGPCNGQWFWAVVVDDEGHNGFSATAEAARLQCEALLFGCESNKNGPLLHRDQGGKS